MGSIDNSTNLIFSVLKDVLDAQEKQKNSIENKASTLLAFAAGLFALLAGSYNTIILFPINSQIAIIVGIVCLVISVLFATTAGWVRKYRIDPNPEALVKNYLNTPEQDTQLQIISNWVETWKTNAEIIEGKATLLRIGFLSQTFAFIFLGVALLFSIFD